MKKNIFILLFSSLFFISGISELYAKTIADNLASVCFITDDGKLKCHDSSEYVGVLSFFSGKDNRDKTDIIPLNEKITSLDMSSLYLCVITENKNVECLGSSQTEELSADNFDNKSFKKIRNLDNIVSISTGEDHACAINLDGIAKCWGDNKYGQLGDNTTNNSSVPVEVKISDKIKKIVVGSGFSCVLTDKNNVKCFGNNKYGQLGNGNKENSLVSVEVLGLTNIKDFGAYDNSVCALTNDNIISCWGSNSEGQLAADDLHYEDFDLVKSSVTDSNIPVEIKKFNENVVNIIVGRDYYCALLENGNVECWGVSANILNLISKNVPVLQIFTKQNISTKSVLLNNVNLVKEITSGENNFCVLEKTGKLKCLDIPEDPEQNDFKFKEIR